ncbi:hypothetical protein QBC47DRAFT_438186 [Echria macrotheca]|uniref:HNH nuclease domain-containing protein n=1 Tax=Echria macrotheca TaxID=438768 RepID=A0AAJ0BL14_9PEZI|nr:hypothetical protein QBC47DRAFT_438186 [Echria macrotheca]
MASYLSQPPSSPAKRFQQILLQHKNAPFSIIPLGGMTFRFHLIQKVENFLNLRGHKLSRFGFAIILFAPIETLRDEFSLSLMFALREGEISLDKHTERLVRTFVTKPEYLKPPSAPSTPQRPASATSSRKRKIDDENDDDDIPGSHKRGKSKNNNTDPISSPPNQNSQACPVHNFVSQKFDAQGNLQRNPSVAARRKALDNNKCLLLGTPDPEACHIIPFSSCNNPSNLNTFRDGLAALAVADLLDVSEDPEASLADLYQNGANGANGLGTSDKVWNTISLHPEVCEWWRRAYFGFRCLGIKEKGVGDGGGGGGWLVSVRFYWMPGRLAGFREGNEGVLARWPTETGKNPYLHKRDLDNLRYHPDVPEERRGKRIDTGMVFEIPVDTRAEAKKMRVAFDVQWLLVRIAAMTGLPTMSLQSEVKVSHMYTATSSFQYRDECHCIHVPGYSTPPIPGPISEYLKTMLMDNNFPGLIHKKALDHLNFLPQNNPIP